MILYCAEESDFVRLTITLFKIRVLIFHQEIDIPVSIQKFKRNMTYLPTKVST